MRPVVRGVLCLGLAGATPALATEIDHRAVDSVVAQGSWNFSGQSGT